MSYANYFDNDWKVLPGLGAVPTSLSRKLKSHDRYLQWRAEYDANEGLVSVVPGTRAESDHILIVNVSSGTAARQIETFGIEHKMPHARIEPSAGTVIRSSGTVTFDSDYRPGGRRKQFIYGGSGVPLQLGKRGQMVRLKEFGGESAAFEPFFFRAELANATEQGAAEQLNLESAVATAIDLAGREDYEPGLESLFANVVETNAKLFGPEFVTRLAAAFRDAVRGSDAICEFLRAIARVTRGDSAMLIEGIVGSFLAHPSLDVREASAIALAYLDAYESASAIEKAKQEPRNAAIAEDLQAILNQFKVSSAATLKRDRKQELVA